MYNGKVIEVHRHFNLVEMSQEDPEVKAWLGQSYRGIGPYFEGKTTATGLTFEEQKYLLPELLGIEPTDKDFRKTVVRFYDELVTSIPKEGLKLQISLENDDQELSATNMPLNIKDYIVYRHIKRHPNVAKTKAEAEMLYGKRYYIVDPDGVSQEAVKINDLEDTAFAVYSKYKDDAIKIDQILTMLGVNIKGMKQEDKVLKLKSYAKKDNTLNDHNQKSAFERFIKTAEDKNLEYKYLIQEMIGAQYLARVGNNIVYAETGKKIGDNMEDAVLFFKNLKNSRELNLLKAQYQLLIKKGDEYLPKEDGPLKNSEEQTQ